MLSKFNLKALLASPTAMVWLRVIILLAMLAIAFFARTGVVHADPGWGVVGG